VLGREVVECQQRIAVLGRRAGSRGVGGGRERGQCRGRSSPSLAIAVAAAKIRAGEAACKVAEIAHQVHGAIGFTHEHGLHRLTRRLWSWRDEFGTESQWSFDLGKEVMTAGADALWLTITQA
jgi:acyl-CoA dehydrogenase